jgi:predicted PurR-regulated permease PerM
MANFKIDISEQLNQTAANVTQTSSHIVTGTVSTSFSILLFIVFLIFDTFFLLLYRRLIFIFLLSLVKKESKLSLVTIIDKVQQILRRYIIGILLEVLVVSVISCVAFKIIGFKYALGMGVLTGILNVVPYAGIFTSLLINIILTFTSAGTVKIIWLMVAVVVIHLIDSNIFLPFIVGYQVRLNALIIIVGVAAGAMIWQIPGMFLATPVLAVIKIVCDEIVILKPVSILIGDERNAIEKS